MTGHFQINLDLAIGDLAGRLNFTQSYYQVKLNESTGKQAVMPVQGKMAEVKAMFSRTSNRCINCN